MRCAECKWGHVPRSAEPCDGCNDFDRFEAKMIRGNASFPSAQHAYESMVKPPLDAVTLAAELHALRAEHSRRVAELLEANNRLVEKRREACGLLREAVGLFRRYEQDHWAKIVRPAVTNEDAERNFAAECKAVRNAQMATRIEDLLSEIHA